MVTLPKKSFCILWLDQAGFIDLFWTSSLGMATIYRTSCAHAVRTCYLLAQVIHDYSMCRETFEADLATTEVNLF